MIPSSGVFLLVLDQVATPATTDNMESEKALPVTAAGADQESLFEKQPGDHNSPKYKKLFIISVVVAVSVLFIGGVILRQVVVNKNALEQVKEPVQAVDPNQMADQDKPITTDCDKPDQPTTDSSLDPDKDKKPEPDRPTTPVSPLSKPAFPGKSLLSRINLPWETQRRIGIALFLSLAVLFFVVAPAAIFYVYGTNLFR
jgi:hypothetical protein